MIKANSSKIAFAEQTAPGLLPIRIDLARFLIISMVLITFLSIFHVWSRSHLIELNLELGKVNKQWNELEQEQKRLRLEIESLKTPARIEVIAKRDLGMVAPQDHQIIQVK